MSVAHESLNRSPKKNWVEKAGQLPAAIQHMAKDIHEEKGLPLDQAIPIAISQAKKLAAKGNAKYVAAVAEWEKLKAKAGKLRESVDLDVDALDAYVLSAEEEAMVNELDLRESPLNLTIDTGDLSLLETATLGGTRTSSGSAPPPRPKGITNLGHPVKPVKSTTKTRTRSGASGDFEKEHPRGRGGAWTIKQGASGEDVRTIQRRVGAKADGNFGAMTKQSVMDFQRKHGLVVDGKVGHQTTVALAGHYDAARTAKPGALKGSDQAKFRAMRQKAQGSRGVRETPAAGMLGLRLTLPG